MKNGFETSVPGLYCIGDLTGIPLIKLAAESGYECIEKIVRDDPFTDRRQAAVDEMYDLVIVGAGPAGVSASLRAGELGIRHLLIESTRAFNTIVNFPAGKPVYVTPRGTPVKSSLVFTDGTKESLLGELNTAIEGKMLPLRENETVNRITGSRGAFEVVTGKGIYRAVCVIVAIGKTGNARTLGVPGEKNAKVFTRLIDPGEFRDRDILVAGGGDSAVEAANALAESGNRVTLSYRKATLSRPKEHNLIAFNRYLADGTITALFESNVKEIRDRDVVISIGGEKKNIPNDVVFTLIGTEFPVAFFRRSHIRMEGERCFSDWMKNIALVLFASVLYFGKKAATTPVDGLAGFFRVPGLLSAKAWPKMVNGTGAWVSFTGLVIVMLYLIVHFTVHRSRYFTSLWDSFRYLYYFAVAGFIGWLYVAYKLLQVKPFFNDMGGWYTVLYSLTIVVFGLRRMAVTPTGYVRRQTLMLMVIQVLPLCILPMFVFPALGRHGLLGDWVMENVFPGGSYWRAYGFVLAWPLFIYNIATHQPTLFWLITGLIQSFVFIPVIVYRWGKGAYCGWICSCGALAETLGDEYRSRAPHGPVAKQWENTGQVVLWFAGIVTILVLLSAGGGALAGVALDIYSLIVDIIFAGVLGVGVYFFMSGRVWCRFFCPLAALMHIYARFSVYRIFSAKKRCISCNICTKVCHMGIDVMNYANRGIPMNDVECVRCSACIVNCPMQVLTFGHTGTPEQADGTVNTAAAGGWASGLSKEGLELLQER